MRSLFLDLASHHGLLACVSDTAVVASSPVDHRIDDAELLPHVEAVLSQAGWKYSDLTHLACVIGPGGFTSLRVAVALANALSHELNIPSVGIHLSDLYEARVGAVREPLLQQNFVWLHSTKKNELFLRGFGSLAQRFPQPQCITLEELETKLKGVLSWTGELIPEHEALVTRLGLVPAALRLLEAILPEFLRQQTFAPKQTLTPWYGRGW